MAVFFSFVKRFGNRFSVYRNLNNFIQSYYMHQAFIDYLKKTGLNDLELQRIEKVIIPRKLRRRQYLLQEGEIARYNCFVVSGCLRMFHLSKSGTEHILRFAIENYWLSDYESYHAGKPSKCFIEALEDCELILITKEDLDLLCNDIPNLRMLKDNWDVQCSDASQNRILSIISETPEERYTRFLQTNPHVFNRVPLHMVASYLGISRKTISRIRQSYGR